MGNIYGFCAVSYLRAFLPFTDQPAGIYILRTHPGTRTAGDAAVQAGPCRLASAGWADPWIGHVAEEARQGHWAGKVYRITAVYRAYRHAAEAFDAAAASEKVASSIAQAYRPAGLLLPHHVGLYGFPMCLRRRPVNDKIPKDREVRKRADDHFPLCHFPTRKDWMPVDKKRTQATFSVSATSGKGDRPILFQIDPIQNIQHRHTLRKRIGIKLLERPRIGVKAQQFDASFHLPQPSIFSILSARTIGPPSAKRTT